MVEDGKGTADRGLGGATATRSNNPHPLQRNAPFTHCRHVTVYNLPLVKRGGNLCVQMGRYGMVVREMGQLKQPGLSTGDDDAMINLRWLHFSNLVLHLSKCFKWHNVLRRQFWIKINASSKPSLVSLNKRSPILFQVALITRVSLLNSSKSSIKKQTLKANNRLCNIHF